MANLPLAVDADLIRRARVRAIQEGTSLGAKVREFLQQHVDGASKRTAADREAAALQLMRLLDAATGGHPGRRQHALCRPSAARAALGRSDPGEPVPGAGRRPLTAVGHCAPARAMTGLQSPSGASSR
jgi:plasmid stability protein